MNITHDILLELGFIERFNPPGRYEYKGVRGRLTENGRFQLPGFSLLIEQVSDLKYLMKLVDYQYYQSADLPLPYHVN